MKLLTAAELIQKAKPVFPRADCIHHPIDVSQNVRDNLEKLATYLYALPDDYEKFSMRYWAWTGKQLTFREPNPKIAHQCGTVACAAGHAILVVEPPAEDDLTWGHYIVRVLTEANYSLEQWAFSGGWSEVDNTPQGAAKRIFYALQHGVPATAQKQLMGRSPLCY